MRDECSTPAPSSLLPPNRQFYCKSSGCHQPKGEDMASSTHHRTDTNTSSRSRTAEDAGAGTDRPIGIEQVDETDEHLGEGVMHLLSKVGFDEQTVQATVAQWRSQLGSNVSRQIEEADLLELLDKA